MNTLQHPRLALGAGLLLLVALALLGALPYLALGWNALWPLVAALGGGRPADAPVPSRPAPSVVCVYATSLPTPGPALASVLGCRPVANATGAARAG